MNPKQKADELISKMLQFQPLSEKGFINEKQVLENATNSALIAVEEILRLKVPIDNIEDEQQFYSFWQSVKDHLINR